MKYHKFKHLIVFLFILFISIAYINYLRLYSYNRPDKFSLFIDDSSYLNKIHEIENFLTFSECNYLIDISSGKLSESEVYTEKRLEKSMRKSKSCLLDRFRYNVSWVKDRLEKYIPYVKNHSTEPLQISQYDKGGYYREHYDACPYDEETCREFDGYYGPRFLTCLIYLNDDYEGGETYFPQIKKYIIPKKGKALIFLDTNKEGSIIRESLHTGTDIKNGKKWIATLWVRKLKKFFEL